MSPLLVDKGFFAVTELHNVTENSNALVAQPGRALMPLNDEIDNKKKREALGGIRARDLYLNGVPSKLERHLTKVTLYQAELPRQLDEQSSQ
jgi:hypothetical protein